jgi:chromosome segregation ATPase
MNGNEKYLTKSLFMKICAAFPGVFNLDYLLNGTGTLLAQQKEAEPTPASPATDNLLELHASMLRHVDDLRQNLHAELSEVQSLRHSLSEELSAIRELKDKLRATLQELQRSNNAILAELQRSNNHDIGIAAETLDKH